MKMIEVLFQFSFVAQIRQSKDSLYEARQILLVYICFAGGPLVKNSIFEPYQFFIRLCFAGARPVKDSRFELYDFFVDLHLFCRARAGKGFNF